MTTLEKLSKLAGAMGEKAKDKEEKDAMFQNMCNSVDKIVNYSNEKARQTIYVEMGESMYNREFEDDANTLNLIKSAANANIAEAYDDAVEAMDDINNIAMENELDDVFDVDFNDKRKVDEVVGRYVYEAYDVDFDIDTGAATSEIDLDDEENKSTNIIRSRRLSELNAEFGDITGSPSGPSNDYMP